MIKTVVAGIWVCLVTLASGYMGIVWDDGSGDQTAKGRPTALVKFKPVNLPIIRDSNVAGYVLVQFSAVTDAEELKKTEVKPEVFFLDAVYKHLYARPDTDLTHFASDDWTALAKGAKEAVNTQYGVELIKSILLDEFGFIPAGATRKDASPSKKKAAGPAEPH